MAILLESGVKDQSHLREPPRRWAASDFGGDYGSIIDCGIVKFNCKSRRSFIRVRILAADLAELAAAEDRFQGR